MCQRVKYAEMHENNRLHEHPALREPSKQLHPAPARAKVGCEGMTPTLPCKRPAAAHLDALHNCKAELAPDAALARAAAQPGVLQRLLRAGPRARVLGQQLRHKVARLRADALPAAALEVQVVPQDRLPASHQACSEVSLKVPGLHDEQALHSSLRACLHMRAHTMLQENIHLRMYITRYLIRTVTSTMSEFITRCALHEILAIAPDFGDSWL